MAEIKKKVSDRFSTRRLMHGVCAQAAGWEELQGRATYTFSSKPILQIKPGVIEAHPSELTILVHYEVRSPEAI